MSERLEFVQCCLDRKRSISDICDQFGISQKTGYKLLRRFREQGPDALGDRSRARLTHPYHITPEVAARIISLRKKYPRYGPRMLRDRLSQHEPDIRWPAASSIGELIKRANLIRTKRRRDRSHERHGLDTGRTKALEPNMVWTADFKGEFRLKAGMGCYCYPLTVMDLHTRYLLGCTALESVAVSPTQKIFVRLFREYGLPSVIRTDNGIPFAQANAIGRLGRLGFMFVRLGIRPEHIKPATPSENGAHERFHRTLKAEATKPASPSMRSQQLRFDEFKTEYNIHRPHTSLPDHVPPGQLYTHSPRAYPEKLPVMIYPEHAEVRLVQHNGVIKWKNHELSITTNLAGQYVGLTETEGAAFTITYGKLELGSIDIETCRFIPRVRWTD